MAADLLLVNVGPLLSVNNSHESAFLSLVLFSQTLTRTFKQTSSFQVAGELIAVGRQSPPLLLFFVCLVVYIRSPERFQASG